MHDPTSLTAPRPLRVLLVEDDEMNRSYLRIAMEKMGHAVAVAVNGREAVRAASEEEFDLVLMDVQMPGMDGLEATRTIRGLANRQRAGVYIAAMTAYALEGDRERCLAAGMDDYLSKPVERSALERFLNALPEPGAPRARRPEAGSKPDPASACEPAPRPEAPDTAAAAGLLDLHYTLELMGGAPESLAAYGRVVGDKLPAQMTSLQRALDQGEMENLSRLLHSLKTTLKTLGAASTAEFAAKGEQAANQGNAAEARRQIEYLTPLVARILDELNARLADGEI